MVIQKIPAELALHDYITAHLKTPFEWGKHDCVLFSSAWVAHKTGVNPVEGFPEWKSMKKAHRIIRRVGGLEAAMDRRLKRVHPNLANDGDVGLCDGVVCLLSGPHAVAPGPNGLVFKNRMDVTCAWSY